jgi:hypothetical protein
MTVVARVAVVRMWMRVAWVMMMMMMTRRRRMRRNGALVLGWERMIAEEGSVVGCSVL